MSKEFEPTVITIFGVSGDLAGRKVLPALYHLLKDGLLPEKIKIVGTSRKDLSKDQLLKNVELCVLETDKVCDPVVLSKFNKIFEIIKLDPVNEKDYIQLKNYFEILENKENVCFNRLFYLSIPPQIYSPVIRILGESGLSKKCHHGFGKSRILVEKPFGYDLSSAETLIKKTSKYFKEEQIFRIDHYLAKETAQNILVFRGHNPIFRDIWNNNSISRIHIKALESIGIEGRANFYDSVGALRDIVQSHLLQLMAITTMDIPEDINSSDLIHQQKSRILSKTELSKINRGSVIRGQYKTYRKEIGKPKSNTETYVRLMLNIKTKQWMNVPIILETGKALVNKNTAIVIDFSNYNDQQINELTIRIQPDEGIDIKLFVKKPGFDNVIETAIMDFSYQNTFDHHYHPDAYERVIIDAIKGDQSLFSSNSEVVRSWQILQPILNRWKKDNNLILYENGSNGP